jgi:cell division protein FtsN
MSRDYKKKSKSNGAGGGARPMGVGIFIGLLLGLCLALGVALYINKGPNPFVDKYEPAPSPPSTTNKQKGSKESKAPEVKLEFDFYKILPGWEEAVTDRDFKRQTARTAKEIFFLQVAAFPKAADADNLKARLALSGIESKIQTAQLPDGKTWHRVRIGPFEDQNELSETREALKRIELEANLIKVRRPE